MISVDEAQNQLFELVHPLGSELVSLSNAFGRVLSVSVVTDRNQPPFASSAMDGYAVAAISPGEPLQVIGTSAAGNKFFGTVSKGEAVRIFTGGVVPNGATRVVIQEDVISQNGAIILKPNADSASYIRKAAADFAIGHELPAPRKLNAIDIALLAAMNIPQVEVFRKPIVAILATGDELVMPGETPSDDQIIASNALGLKGIFEESGALVRILPIAKDTTASLKAAIDLAKGADLLVTIGGASVGDHDLVRQVMQEAGLVQSFYKVAMRPGKPLMAGKLGQMTVVGLPGNPVSSILCGMIFICPMIQKLLGLGNCRPTTHSLPLTHALASNGPRQHYMRAIATDQIVSVFERQDSALLTVLAQANALVVRPPNARAAEIGEIVDIIRF